MPGGALAVFEAYVAVTFVYYCQITAAAEGPCKGGVEVPLLLIELPTYKCATQQNLNSSNAA